MTHVLMAIRIAHRALRRNTLRSALTMLGVIIGVAAVIAILAIGQGAQAAIRAQIASLGSHTLVIQPGSMTRSGVWYGWGSRTSLRVVDVQAILTECPAVAYESRAITEESLERLHHAYRLKASGTEAEPTALCSLLNCGTEFTTMFLLARHPSGNVQRVIDLISPSI